MYGCVNARCVVTRLVVRKTKGLQRKREKESHINLLSKKQKEKKNTTKGER
jgi:hypothetical protein